jgi:hypothetical protein
VHSLLLSFEGTQPLGRQAYIKDNIKMDLKEIGYEDVEWFHLAHSRVQWRIAVNTVMNLRVS